MGLFKKVFDWLDLYRDKFSMIRDFVYLLAFVSVIPYLKSSSFRWLFAFITLYICVDLTMIQIKRALIEGKDLIKIEKMKGGKKKC